MNLKENLSIYFTEMTKTDRKITAELMKNPKLLLEYSIHEAAAKMDVSPAAITRMAKTVGYVGLKDFKKALAEYEKTYLEESAVHEDLSLSATIVNSYHERLDTIARSISDEQIDRVIELMNNARTTKMLGIGSSGLYAEQLVYLLYYQHRYFEAVTSQTKIFYLTQDLVKDDLVIIYSVSVTPEQYDKFLVHCKEAGTKVVIITMNGSPKLKRKCDELIVLPIVLTDFSENQVQQLDNRFAFHIFNEILAMHIHQKLDKGKK